jgi:hypothetical protein
MKLCGLHKEDFLQILYNVFQCLSSIASGHIKSAVLIMLHVKLVFTGSILHLFFCCCVRKFHIFP